MTRLLSGGLVARSFSVYCVSYCNQRIRCVSVLAGMCTHLSQRDSKWTRDSLEISGPEC